MRRFDFAVVLLLSASVVGCGGSVDRPKTVPVTATVVHNGNPVEGATVTFVPSGSAGATASATADGPQGAVGQTDAQGNAVMWTFEPGDGVLPGAYRVAIRKLEVLSLPDPESVSPEEYTRLSQAMEASLAAGPKHLVPKRYSSAETSGLTTDVVDGGAMTMSFELTD